jgi:outer membrane protein OmpA-like peptidoglycan-associated protein
MPSKRQNSAIKILPQLAIKPQPSRGFQMKSALIVTTAFTLLLSACTTNPYTGELQPSKTALGAGTGAILGGIVGAVAAGDRKAALIGAGIGALAGGGIGAYMDNQESQLRDDLEGTGVSVSREGDSIVLNMPSNITFDSDRAELKPQFYPTLNSVASVFKKYNQTIIDVVGHTDASGTPDYNYDLSRRRAAAVAQYLSSQQLDPNRFSVEGHGEKDPIASNATKSGKAQNRRVEITILPLT